ncbi:MAG: TonB-dependent receptor [Bacteroidales bacterium]|nr:TonB-dependent receptor [Bacteroidales bacterium]
MRKLILIPFILLALYFEGRSQAPDQPKETVAVSKVASVKGMVHDSTSNGAIEYATVGLYRLPDSSLVTGLITDERGAFWLRDLPLGNFYLQVHFIGYHKKNIPLLLTQSNLNPDLGVIALHPYVKEIGEVVITAQSNRVDYRIDKKVVNVTSDLNAAGGTLVNVLENTPSVQVDVEGNVSLRGSGNFQLLIDGKPSVIQGSDGLQQIPASAVQSLEIITSPSAKYDPDGEAGIINVIMKKQKNTGIGGIVNASIGTRDKYTADFLLNFKKNKLNYFIGGEWTDQNFHMKGENERRTYLFDTTTTTLAKVNGLFSRASLNLKSGFDFYINDQTTFSLSGAIGNRDFNRSFISSNHWFTLPATIDSFYTDESNGTDRERFYNLNADYQRKFNGEGHNLQASVYYSAATEDEGESEIVTKTNSQYEQVGSDPARTRSRMKNPESNLRIELDYTRPVGKGKVELGLQSRWDRQEGNYIFEDFHPAGDEWLSNDSISNSLDYLDALQSVYTTYGAPLGKFEFQVGLRAEYDNRSLEQKTSSESYTYEKMHFFPSFYIMRKLSDAHQFQFTYTTRIQRPSMWNLNPFKEFRGSNNVFYGNPALTPEFTNAFELNYQYTFKSGSLSLETYYRKTNDKITRITGIDTLSGRQVFVNTITNADEDHSLGVELMANINVTKWWQLNLTGNVFRYQLNGEVEGNRVSSVSNTWRTNFNSSFKLKWDTRFQLTGFYNGPSKTLQGEQDGFVVINAAIRKEFLKKQLSVALNARDIFATGARSFTSSGETFYTYNKFRREAPVVTLNLTYRINNYRQAANRRDVQQEMNGGGEDMM